MKAILLVALLSVIQLSYGTASTTENLLGPRPTKPLSIPKTPPNKINSIAVDSNGSVRGLSKNIPSSESSVKSSGLEKTTQFTITTKAEEPTNLSPVLGSPLKALETDEKDIETQLFIEISYTNGYHNPHRSNNTALKSLTLSSPENDSSSIQNSASMNGNVRKKLQQPSPPRTASHPGKKEVKLPSHSPEKPKEEEEKEATSLLLTDFQDKQGHQPLNEKRVEEEVQLVDTMVKIHTAPDIKEQIFRERLRHGDRKVLSQINTKGDGGASLTPEAKWKIILEELTNEKEVNGILDFFSTLDQVMKKILFEEAVHFYQKFRQTPNDYKLAQALLGESVDLVRSFVVEHANALSVGQWEWLLCHALNEQQALAAVEAATKLRMLLDPDILFLFTGGKDGEERARLVQLQALKELHRRSQAYFKTLPTFAAEQEDNFQSKMAREARYLDFVTYKSIHESCGEVTMSIFLGHALSLATAVEALGGRYSNIKPPMRPTSDEEGSPQAIDYKSMNTTMATAYLARLIRENNWQAITGELLAKASFLGVAQAYKACPTRENRQSLLQLMPRKTLTYTAQVFFPSIVLQIQPAPSSLNEQKNNASRARSYTTKSYYTHHDYHQEHYDDLLAFLREHQGERGGCCKTCCLIL